MKGKETSLKVTKRSYKKEMEKKNLAKSKNKENRKRMNSQRMMKNGVGRNYNLKKTEPSLISAGAPRVIRGESPDTVP